MVNAWTGEVGRADRRGDGAQRAHRTRGGAVASGGADVWRISDLADIGGAGVPADVAERLRAAALSRSSGTRNAAPNDREWSPGVPVPSLAAGAWASQRWHTVVLPAVDAPQGAPRRAVPRGYRTNGAVPTIPPASRWERADDLRYAVRRLRIERGRRLLAERRRAVRRARLAAA